MLLSLALIIALLAVPAGITVSTGDALPVASAQPPPGEPGGNHSKPGDNKKKKKRDDQRRSTNPSRRGSDQSDPRQQQGDSRQGTSQRPTSTVEAQQKSGLPTVRAGAAPQLSEPVRERHLP